MKRVLSLLFCILLTVSSLSSIGRGAEEVRAQIDAAEVYLNALSGLTDLSDPSVALSKFDGPLTAADHSTDLRRVLGHVRVDYFQRLIRRLTEKSEASAENVLMRPEDLCRQGHTSRGRRSRFTSLVFRCEDAFLSIHFGRLPPLFS